MNAPKWPGPDEGLVQGRLLGVVPRPATKAFDFGDPAPRGGWPAPGSPVSPPARSLPWPEAGARAPQVSGRASPGPRRRHVVGYPVALLVGVAIGVAAGGLPGSGGRAAPAGAPGGARVAAAGEASTGDGATSGDRPASRPDRGHRFGDTVRLADGSTVTASAPVASAPDGDAGRPPRHVRLKVTYAGPGGEPAQAGAADVREAGLATLTVRLGVAGNDVVFTNEEKGRTARD